jgi:hypothetical protein
MPKRADGRREHRTFCHLVCVSASLYNKPVLIFGLADGGWSWDGGLPDTNRGVATEKGNGLVGKQATRSGNTILKEPLWR